MLEDTFIITGYWGDKSVSLGNVHQFEVVVILTTVVRVIEHGTNQKNSSRSATIGDFLFWNADYPVRPSLLTPIHEPRTVSLSRSIIYRDRRSIRHRSSAVCKIIPMTNRYQAQTGTGNFVEQFR